MKNLNFYNNRPLFLSYLAGFIDGDGSILVQIVKRPDYIYKFQIRISLVLYQKTSRYWFLLKMYKFINLFIFNNTKFGTLRNRNDNVSELAFVGYTPVKLILKAVLPYLIIKKSLANLTLDIIYSLDKVNNRSDFIQVCKLVDKVAEFTDSKLRKNTSAVVIQTLCI